MQSHWIHVQRLAEALLYLLATKANDGIACYFVNGKEFVRVRSPSRLRELLHDHIPLRSFLPSKAVPLQGTLETIIGVEGIYRKKFTRPKPPRIFARSRPKKAILFVFTDGIWHPETTTCIQDLIKNMVDTMTETKQSPDHFGIQFIRFGDDPESVKVLTELDNMGLSGSRDIVDVESYESGNVLKILLGSINKWFDYADREDDDTSSLKDDLEDDSEVGRHVSRPAIPIRRRRVQELDDDS